LLTAKHTSLTDLDYWTSFVHNSRSTGIQAWTSFQVNTFPQFKISLTNAPQSGPLYRPDRPRDVRLPSPQSSHLLTLNSLTTLWLMLLNKKHSKRRVQIGKSAVIIDRSMMNTQERAVDGAVSEEVEDVGNKAFDDETDLKNEDFVFVY
jgi:hypothetical protein